MITNCRAFLCNQNLAKGAGKGEYPNKEEEFHKLEKNDSKALYPEDPVGKGKSNYFDKLSVATFTDGKSLHYGGRGNALIAGGRQKGRAINGTDQIGFGSTDPPRTDEYCFDPNAKRWTSYLLKEEAYQRGFRANRKPNFSDSTLRWRGREVHQRWSLPNRQISSRHCPLPFPSSPRVP
jgi:hypothetical protein